MPLADITKTLGRGNTSPCVARFSAKSGVRTGQTVPRWRWIASGCSSSMPPPALPFGGQLT